MSLELRIRALATLWQVRARGLEVSRGAADQRVKTLRECADDLLGVLEEKKP